MKLLTFIFMTLLTTLSLTNASALDGNNSIEYKLAEALKEIANVEGEKHFLLWLHCTLSHLDEASEVLRKIGKERYGDDLAFPRALYHGAGGAFALMDTIEFACDDYMEKEKKLIDKEYIRFSKYRKPLELLIENMYYNIELPYIKYIESKRYIKERTPSNQSDSFFVYDNFDLYGSDYYRIDSTDYWRCAQACINDDRCKAFTFNKPKEVCFLKSAASCLNREPQGISGVLKNQSKPYLCSR